RRAPRDLRRVLNPCSTDARDDSADGVADGGRARTGSGRPAAHRLPQLEHRRMTRAYKFLRPGGVAPFTSYAWPLPQGEEPGAWVEVETVEPCRRGVHACTRDDLPYWFQDELWEVELDGEVQRVGHKLAARRGRLVRRVDAWNAERA